MFIRYKIPIIVSVIVLIYGLTTLILKSNFTFDFGIKGFLFLLEEMKTYILAVGAVVVTYSLSVDRAKKEIKEEEKKIFEKEKKKLQAQYVKGFEVCLDNMTEFIENWCEIMIDPTVKISRFEKNDIPLDILKKSGKLYKLQTLYNNSLNDLCLKLNGFSNKLSSDFSKSFEMMEVDKEKVGELLHLYQIEFTD